LYKILAQKFLPFNALADDLERGAGLNPEIVVGIVMAATHSISKSLSKRRGAGTRGSEYMNPPSLISSIL
jgi:hypothetical protein